MAPPNIPGLASLASLAALVRHRLAEVAPQLTRRDDTTGCGPDMMVVGAAAPFAATSYARARLLRQLHACGLLTTRETGQATQLLDTATGVAS